MALHRIPLEELRSICRQKLETCELWLRRLIHEQFSYEFGSTYFQAGTHNGNPLFRKEIRRHAQSRMQDQPNRYRQEIDTLLMDHLVDTICKSDIYSTLFREALNDAFPDGNSEARTFLSRLVPIRNALSHANPLSIHDAERVLCYCDDVIESIKAYYKKRNMEQEYNAPRFIRFSDSFGHSELISQPKQSLNYKDFISLRPGDSIRLEVEVDSSFHPDDYSVNWSVQNVPAKDTGNGHSFLLTITFGHVGQSFSIWATLVSKREWHRNGTYDAMIQVAYKILPPLN